MMKNTARICLVLVASLTSVFAELVIKPKDTESIVGGSAYFNCSTTDLTKEIQWSHHSIDPTDKNFVYVFGEIRGVYQGRFSVKHNNLTGAYDLVIIAITERDAGTYECQDQVGYGNKSQAELVVLKAKPECRSDMPLTKVIGANTCGIEPDAVRLSCTATFRGNIAPVLQWRKVGESDPVTQNVAAESSGNRVAYNLTLKGDVIINGSSYSCQLTRSSSSEQYGCVSDVIRILTPQNEFSIAERKVGEQIYCPTVVENLCSYKWMHNDRSGEATVSTGQLLKPHVSGLYRCEAHCVIKTKSCTVSAMIVHVTEDTSTTESFADDNLKATTYKVPFIVALILLVICVLMFIVCFIRWNRLWKRRGRAPVIEMQPLKTADILVSDASPTVVYSPNPNRIHTIKTQAAEENDRSIKGIAILNNELFIISQLESEVEVFDCTTLSFRRRWQLNDLMDPDDATACVRNRCIYISDNKAAGKEIFRVDVDGKIINSWPINEESGRLSVTHQSNVLLILHDSNKLKEFSPDGVLKREINLEATHPMHVVSLINGNFIVTQGYLEDRVHKLCEVNPNGKVVRSFGAEKGSGNAHVTNPTYLAVDRDGSILVADAGNGRVILLGPNLSFKRELVNRNNGLHIPTRIALDEINGRLLVAEYKKEMRSLLVFNIRQTPAVQKKWLP